MDLINSVTVSTATMDMTDNAQNFSLTCFSAYTSSILEL